MTLADIARLGAVSLGVLVVLALIVDAVTSDRGDWYETRPTPSTTDIESGDRTIEVSGERVSVNPARTCPECETVLELDLTDGAFYCPDCGGAFA